MAGTEPVRVIAAWAAMLALAHVVRVASPSGGRMSLAPAVAVAWLLLGSTPADVAAVFALGIAGSRLVLRAVGVQAAAGTSSFLREAAGLAVLLAVFELTAAPLDALGTSEEWRRLAQVTLAGASWFLADAALRTAWAVGRDRMRLRYVWLLALEDWPVVVSLVASGSLFGFVVPEIGWWALPVALIPYGFSHVAFGRYYGARRTYSQMIQGLSRIPEVAGLSPDGHSVGTAALATEIGKDMGCRPEEVLQLEYAALLHDIGSITLNGPDGDETRYSQADLATWGAEIVSQAHYLDDVARVVRQHHRAYRRPGEARDPAVPLASRIVKVAGTYDRSTRALGLDSVEALELLHKGAAYDYDPEVVLALRRVLVKRRGISGSRRR